MFSFLTRSSQVFGWSHFDPVKQAGHMHLEGGCVHEPSGWQLVRKFPLKHTKTCCENLGSRDSAQFMQVPPSYQHYEVLWTIEGAHGLDEAVVDTREIYWWAAFNNRTFWNRKSATKQLATMSYANYSINLNGSITNSLIMKSSKFTLGNRCNRASLFHCNCITNASVQTSLSAGKLVYCTPSIVPLQLW